MKFEPGQIVIHEPTKSRWIIMETKPYDSSDPQCELFKRPQQPTQAEKYKILINAYCLYSGNKPDYWQPNQLDDWVMTYRDCEEHDKIWTII